MGAMSPEPSAPRLVLAVVDDLLFLSKIQEAARAAGLAVRAARGPAAALPDLAGAAGAVAVLVDLDSARLPLKEWLPALRADARTSALPVVGFFSHVHAERGREAQAAGCTRVLPRGAFVQELPRLLADLAGA
jgi:CheY-like chemotaxis protein